MVDERLCPEERAGKIMTDGDHVPAGRPLSDQRVKRGRAVYVGLRKIQQPRNGAQDVIGQVSELRLSDLESGKQGGTGTWIPERPKPDSLSDVVAEHIHLFVCPNI
jgi:hypothetical protein